MFEVFLQQSYVWVIWSLMSFTESGMNKCFYVMCLCRGTLYLFHEVSDKTPHEGGLRMDCSARSWGAAVAVILMVSLLLYSDLKVNMSRKPTWQCVFTVLFTVYINTFENCVEESHFFGCTVITHLFMYFWAEL